MGASSYEEVRDGSTQPQVVNQPQWVYQPPPSDATRTRPWMTDICSCFQDVGLCLDVLLCYPCMQGRIYSAVIDQRPDHMHPLVCCAFVGVGSLDWAGDLMRVGFLWWMRSRVRETFRISGNAWLDCLAATFCGPCMTCQLYRELSSHGVNPGYTCCQPDTYDPTPQPPSIIPVQPGYSGGNYGATDKPAPAVDSEV